MIKNKEISMLVGGSLLALGTIVVLSSCKTIPKGVVAIQNFDQKKYLGHWYEIARLDFHFEKM